MRETTVASNVAPLVLPWPASSSRSAISLLVPPWAIAAAAAVCSSGSASKRLTTASKERFKSQLGTLTIEEMKAIEKIIKIQLGMQP
jgi:hypothetical protein